MPPSGLPRSTRSQPIDGTELACEALPAGTLTGKVALVQRGTCFFTSKATNVANAGAEAMVVYNNVDGPTVTMGAQQKTEFEIPSVMIEKSEGEALRDFLLPGAVANATLQPLAPVPAQADVLANFSSRGPNIDLSIKPDLTAPGQDMYTASNNVTPEPQYSADVNGTSFSTPLVSGAAALVKQLPSRLVG